MTNSNEPLSERVHRELLHAAGAGWSIARYRDDAWAVRAPPGWLGVEAPVLEYGVELLGTRLAVTHGNTDAGGFHPGKLLVRATLVEVTEAVNSGVSVATLLRAVFERHPPNALGLT